MRIGLCRARWAAHASTNERIPPIARYFAALSLGYAYSALILSFLGEMWWGIAARGGDQAPPWLWFAAVAPSLIALASVAPWAIGAPWPRPSLVLLGLSLIASLAVDARLLTLALCPAWWMTLRVRYRSA